MKKLLLLLAGLLFAVLPSKAQETESTSYRVSEVGITKVEALTEGDYIIYAVPGGTGKNPAYVGYRDNNDDSKGKVFIKPGLDVSTGEVSDVNYIWTVTKDAEGNISIALKSAPEEKFWTKDSQWGNNMSGTDKAIYIPENNDGTNTGISLRLKDIINTNGSNGGSTTTSPAYVCCNLTNTSNEYCLSYWEGKTGSTKFTFYKLQEKTDNYPFICSDAPTAEGFSPNTYWYYMTLSNAYVTHVEGQDYCPAAATTNPIEYGSFWAFVKNEAGQIEIYNAATGPDYVLASSSPLNDGKKGGNTHPIMKEKSTLADTEKGVWNIKHTGSDNFFFLNIPGEGEEDSYINSRESTLAFWVDASSSTNDGSKLRVQEVDINTLINTVREQQSAVSGAVGTLDSESYADFTAALNKGTAEGLAEALKIRDLTGTTIQFEPSKYYYIYNGKDSQTGYITINKENKLITENNKSGISKLFKFEETGKENIYNLKVQGVYIEKAAENDYNVQLGITSNESDKGEFQLIEAETGAGVFRIKNTNSTASGNTFIFKNYGNITGWSGTSNGSQWYLIEAPSITTEITSAGYATVNYPFAVQLPENESISAYIGTVIPNDNSKLLLKKISNGLIPANTPVVLEGVKGEEKTYTLTIVTDNASTNPDGNVLKGTLLPEAISETFVLGMNNDNVGFYKLSNTDNTVGANKAYLPKSALPTLPASVRGVTFSFDDNSGETTGIEDATINLAEEEFYDLQGRRVMNPTKGIYVTKSGKKVLFTK